MGSILNPAEINFFADLVKAKDFKVFVDKTDFIAKTNALLNFGRNLLTVARPRRFGKTVTAHMLLAYYSKAYAGQSIFDGLKITNKDNRDSYAKHLNKYDVIYIDMNYIRGKYNEYLEDEELHVKGVATLVDFLKYAIIEELKENKDYATLLSKNSKIGKKSLLSALQAICKYTGERFVLIMDEWDLVYREYQNDTKLQEKFIDLLTSLFKTDGGLSCFALAYLTGILPIKKYNSQSALNDFDEYNMLAPGDYAPYFGFTDAEVADIVKSPNCKVSHEELKEWYEGYKIKGVDIYNPNSVYKAVSRNECISYWSGTSSNEEFVRLINADFEGLKEDIVNLIEGDEVTFSCANFQNDMVNIKDKHDVFCLLVCLGYLGCSDTKNKYRKIAYVPNAEVKAVLMDIVREQNWYERMETIRRSEDLLKAIMDLDGTTAAKLIQDIHNSPAVSLLDYNDEESLTYCIMTGLLWSTLDDYSYHREEPTGKGRADLVYEPITKKLPLLLIEFKYDDSAAEAIKQIKTREYFQRYIKQYRNIILVGINYSSKTKEHECLIERFG